MRLLLVARTQAQGLDHVALLPVRQPDVGIDFLVLAAHFGTCQVDSLVGDEVGHSNQQRPISGRVRFLVKALKWFHGKAFVARNVNSGLRQECVG